MPTFEKVQGWLPWCVGLGVGMLFLPFTWPFLPLLFANLSLTFVALVGLVRAVYRVHRTSGRYDLRTLRNFDDREELRKLRENERQVDTEQALCVHCGEVYDLRLPFCPNCNRLWPHSRRPK